MKLKVDTQLAVAGAAIVVSLAALFVAWDEARIMRRQQFASVMPIINVEFDAVVEEEQPVIRLRLTNDGVGPAFVQSGVLRVNGHPVATLAAFRAAAMTGQIASQSPRVRLEPTRGVLAPGRTRAPVQLRWEDPSLIESFVPFAYSLASESGGLSFEVCYCSIYEHCWRTDIHGEPLPEAVRRCESEADIYSTFMTETD